MCSRSIHAPDIVIRRGEKKYPFIIDTKYKREDSNADYYPVIAYSLALRNSKACCHVCMPTRRRTLGNLTIS